MTPTRQAVNSDPWRPKMHSRKIDDMTVEPTDIVMMICRACRKKYTANGNGLMITKVPGVYKPCIALPIGSMRDIMSDKETCGCTDYDVYRRMEVRAMPQGRGYNDL